MEQTSRNLTTYIRDAAKALVAQKCAEERHLFDPLWAAIEPSLTEWLQVPATRRSVRKLIAPGNITGLGFRDEQLMDLVTPRVLATMFAAVFDATKLPGTPGLDYISKIVKQYGQRFLVPSELFSSLEKVIHELVRRDFSRAGVFPLGEVMHEEITLIRWDSAIRTDYKEKLSEDIERTRDEKKTFALFLDDLRNEFLVRGVPKKLHMYQRRLFIACLMRVGEYWSYSDLFKRIWDDETIDTNDFHHLLRRLNKATEDMLKPYISLSEEALNRCYVSKGLAQNVKYAAIFVADAY